MEWNQGRPRRGSSARPRRWNGWSSGMRASRVTTWSWDTGGRSTGYGTKPGWKPGNFGGTVGKLYLIAVSDSLVLGVEGG